MISDVLIPLLQQRFPNRGMRVGSHPEPCVTFPAIHPDVGDIQILDDGDEVTLVAGNFTHGHFSNYDKISVPEKEKLISEKVAAFLEKLFSDEVVLWGSHQGIGGWRVISSGTAEKRKHKKGYVWSGPRRNG